MAEELSTDSILGSVKKLIGSDDYFDQDLILHINSVFSILTQLGVGPKNGFSISDDTALWSDFITDNDAVLNMVKTYMKLKVELYFDISSASSYLIDTKNKQCDELEWRLNSYCDYNKEET